MSNFYTTFFRQEKRKIFQELKIIRQLFDSYILCKLEKGQLFIIDQHAAHEKVRYEKICEAYYKKGSLEMQKLINPVLITASSGREKQILIENLEKIRNFGYKIRYAGGDNFTIASVPTFTYRRVVPSIIRKIKETLLNIEDRRIIEEKIIKLLACHSAIHANMKLSRLDMYKLIAQLGNLQNPWLCPHGRPIIRKIQTNGEKKGISILRKELEKQFDRS